ncbi:hypothetical protein KL86PLE_90462 [uncultured Pleomorphomonas sp.]|uniref:Uncharacterized protein n=1 Tax=uncultured Pleomorphomonas sp. TaxID=442121 RepID=A0A212LPL3_9HYPH|nr:hypothetical protein KL86PLE_90462 [uncultured Pleomorphomonas sp.]
MSRTNVSYLDENIMFACVFEPCAMLLTLRRHLSIQQPAKRHVLANRRRRRQPPLSDFGRGEIKRQPPLRLENCIDRHPRSDFRCNQSLDTWLISDVRMGTMHLGRQPGIAIQS